MRVVAPIDASYSWSMELTGSRGVQRPKLVYINGDVNTINFFTTMVNMTSTHVFALEHRPVFCDEPHAPPTTHFLLVRKQLRV